MVAKCIGYFIGLLILVFPVLACSLSAQEQEAAAPTLPALVSSPISTSATNTPSASATPSATATRSQSNSGSNPPAPANPSCTVRSDWLLYTVAAGDTLSKIAQRTGSTVNDLTRANCLSNADSIRVGQQLRVPNLPPTSPTSTPITSSGQSTTSTIPVTFSGNAGDILQPEGRYELRPGASITVHWTDIPSNATRVEFYYGIPGNESAALIGTDTTPANGASVTWVVPANISAVVYALAIRSNDSWHTSASVNVSSNTSITGLVDSANPATGTILLLVDQENTRLTVNATGASFNYQSGGGASLGEVRTWMEIRATGFYGASNTLSFTANAITILDVQPPMQTKTFMLTGVTVQEIQSNGTILIVSGNSYVYLTAPVPVGNPAAKVMDASGNPLSLSDLKVGSVINVSGYQWVGSYYATEVRIVG